MTPNQLNRLAMALATLALLLAVGSVVFTLMGSTITVTVNW